MNWKLTIGTLALAAVLGCSSSKGGVAVRATTDGGGTGATGGTGGTGSSGAALVIDHDVTLDRVRLVVRTVEVEPATCNPTGSTGGTGGTGGTGAVTTLGETACATGSGEDCGETEDDGCALKYGPFLIDLAGDALANGIHWQFEVPVPAGTYHEIAFLVNTIAANQAGTDAGLLEMANLHASVVIEGTLPDGKPFTFAAPFAVEQEREGAIVVDPSAGITLDIDPTHWFTDASGALLDPNDVTNQGAIRENIRASIRVEHDDDGDGCDDEHDTTCEQEHHTGAHGS